MWEAIWSPEGLVALEFPVSDERELLWQELLLAADSEETRRLEKDLQLYLRGGAVTFFTPLDLRGYSEFRKRVYAVARQVEYGQTVTYGALAARMGASKAARAVGKALGENRTPLLIPCHRIVGQGNKLVGFAGGLAMKEALLLLETAGE